jgi:hypothetical protein
MTHDHHIQQNDHQYKIINRKSSNTSTQKQKSKTRTDYNQKEIHNKIIERNKEEIRAPAPQRNNHQQTINKKTLGLVGWLIPVAPTWNNGHS